MRGLSVRKREYGKKNVALGCFISHKLPIMFLFLSQILRFSGKNKSMSSNIIQKFGHWASVNLVFQFCGLHPRCSNIRALFRA